MQPDPSGQPGPAPAAPDHAPPSSVGTAERSAAPASTLNSLEEAFRTAPEALKGSSDRDTDADEQRPPGASDGQRPTDRPSSKPGGEPPGTGTGVPSRRGAAARISEQQAEIDRLLDEREAERAKAAEAETRVKEHETRREEARKAALARIGDDRKFAELSNRRLRGDVLSYEEDEELNGMFAWREHAADLWEIADRAHKAGVARGLADRVEKYGLDKDAAFKSALPELVDHVVAVTEQRVKEAQANELAELRAEVKGLRTRAGRAAVPTFGGASEPGGMPIPPDGASPLAFFEAAVRAADAAPPDRDVAGPHSVRAARRR